MFTLLLQLLRARIPGVQVGKRRVGVEVSASRSVAAVARTNPHRTTGLECVTVIAGIAERLLMQVCVWCVCVCVLHIHDVSEHGGNMLET